VSRLETDGTSPVEFERVVAMATGRHTGEVVVNRGAVQGSVYSGDIYWRQTSTSHYYITPIPRKTVLVFVSSDVLDLDVRLVH